MLLLLVILVMLDWLPLIEQVAHEPRRSQEILLLLVEMVLLWLLEVARRALALQSKLVGLASV